MRLTTAVVALVTATANACLASQRDETAEVPAVRTYFYAGGQYADDGAGGEIFRDQMYVEKLVPAVHGIPMKQTPIVLIHGKAQTGTNFLNKPDGGRGWASQFLSQGYQVYIVDQTLRGRSAWLPGHNATQPSTYAAEIMEQRFTATWNATLWPQAQNHTQWPGSGKRGDPVFDAFYSSNVQFINNATYQQETMQAAGAAFLDTIGGPVILIGHSQGGILPLLLADARPELTQALVLLEPNGPPFRDAVFSTKPARAWGLTDVPLTYSPPVTDPSTDLVQEIQPARDANHVECVLQAQEPAPRRLTNLEYKPILLVTGEASYHAPYDYCVARYLRQAGCSQTQHLELGQVGIHGNGHMMFMEKNSDQIQAVIEEWVRST
ncbi:Alpha/beta hydrolase family-domain-containing protein [Emericellopsis atlantica]|uniref:Alpha/beta hydrolase family-domain-containing protein n=1 Tax=Emericellopsis atlantica TaxID=2614577 RepID=A0A9P8CNX6_9HYPO|nr:Alpha/beta hydrolase family-domain-containing protein [Emericellopsis atlantica]KAG9252196.1 Alpha/beta hydrolase family-domain-containing protein [Emericellopsis atlantica]